MLKHLLAIALLLPVTAHSLDIIEVLQLAEQHDTIYRAAQAQYLADIENESQSDAAFLPELSLNAFASRTTSSTSASSSNASPDGDTRFGSNGYSITLNQTLYDQSLYDDAAADSARSAQAQAEIEAAKQNLYIRVANRYFDLLSKQDALKLALAEQQAISRQLEQNRERFNAGLIAITDIKESQAQYDIATADSIVAENNLNNSREAIRLIINQPIQALTGIIEHLPLVMPEPDDIKAWQENALLNNLRLRARKHQLDAAIKDYASTRADHYPTLSLNAKRSFTSSGGSTISNAFSGSDIDSNRITVNLAIPLYSGGETSSNVRQKLAERDVAKARYEQQQRLTIQQVRSAFLNIKASVSKVKALKQALLSTQSATEATQIGFKAGTRNSVDVLLAQRTQFASENKYAKARYDFLLNVLKLKQATGTLSANDLQQVNQFTKK